MLLFLMTLFGCEHMQLLCCETAELGDYDPCRHSPSYVSELRLVPEQTEEFECRVAALHRRLR